MGEMTPREQEISNEIRATITDAMTGSARSAHSAARRLGISDLGSCREKARLAIENTPYTDEQDNYQAAFNGTAIGDLIEQHLPYETQGEVTVTIPIRDEFALTLVGHPDIIIRDPETGKVKKVWDNKSKSGLMTIRNYGASSNNIMQVTAYGKALIDAGEADADDLELALIYVDRSGDDPQPHVVAWQWRQEDWDEIISWLDDVVEAMMMGESAPKDMPRDSFCANWCFGGETEIVTADGLKRLDALVGQTVKVLAPSGTEGSGSSVGQWVDAKVRSYGVQDLRTITLSRGTRTRKVVRATGNHQWPIEGGMVTTDELLPGHVMKSVTHAGRTFAYVPAGAQQGFVFGDGSGTGVAIYENSPKTPLVDTLFSNHEYTVTPDYSGDRGGARTQIAGIPRHWNDPLGDLSKYDRSFLMSWLAGYFAADGSVSKVGSMTISSAKEENLEMVRSICSILGIRVGQRIVNSRLGYGEVESDLHLISIQSRSLLPDWFFLNPTHRERAEKVGPQKRDYSWKVVSVEDHGETEEVYCAEVPDIKHFVLADFILTHNCEYFSTCRLGDTDVEGLIEHEDYVQAVEAYLHGADLEKQAKQLKKEANSVLRNVTGNVNTTKGMKSLRWVHVNGSHVEFDRASYDRLSITKGK